MGAAGQTRPKIVVAGSINIDLATDLPFLPKPNETLIGGDLRLAVGGKGHNQAVALARLGCDTHFGPGEIEPPSFAVEVDDLVLQDGRRQPAVEHHEPGLALHRRLGQR